MFNYEGAAYRQIHSTAWDKETFTFLPKTATVIAVPTRLSTLLVSSALLLATTDNMSEQISITMMVFVHQ